MARRLAAIMFTDISGYTTLAQEDEGAALRLLEEQETLVRSLVGVHHGRKVKSMGDGLLLEFPDALDAVECGVDLQQRLHERNEQPRTLPLKLRVGIHLGDVQRKGTDILGDAVNIASRVEPLAEPEGVCISSQVYDQVHNKVSQRFESIGPRTLKGVHEAVEIYRVVFPWTRGDLTPASPMLPRLAVLPLDNISPDPNDDYFAEGLTEELISVLSQIGGLRVIARTSVNQYKRTTKPIAQIGAELGVTSILEGSVRKAGDQLRITVQLIDTRTQEHRWAQSYDRYLDDLFAIQADVAQRTAVALKVSLLSSERAAIEERPTPSLRAYELYLRGIQATQRVWGRSDEEVASIDRSAEQLYEGALREDPGFAAAYARFAEHLILVMYVTRPRSEVAPRVGALVSRALELNPNLAEAHMARALVALEVDLDWARAETELQQAIALNPSSSIARSHYGNLLGILQRFPEAKKQLRAAIELDPLRFDPQWSLVDLAIQEGDWPTAEPAVERLLEKFPDNPGVRCNRAFLAVLQRRTRAIPALVEPLISPGFPISPLTRAVYLAFVGRTAEARSIVSEWERSKATRARGLLRAARVYTLLGERERALALIEEDYRTGDRTLWEQYLSPLFDPIRADPRFVAVLRAMKLPTTLVRSWRAEFGPPVPRAERRGRPSQDRPAFRRKV